LRQDLRVGLLAPVDALAADATDLLPQFRRVFAAADAIKHFFAAVGTLECLSPAGTSKPIGLHPLLDGVTNPKYKLLRFIQLAKRRGH
jgi:hypothetical protein